MTLSTEEIRKNEKDLRFQHYISLRNIFFGGAITLIIGLWGATSELNLSFSLRASIIGTAALIMIGLGLLSWRRARRSLEEIRSLT